VATTHPATDDHGFIEQEGPAVRKHDLPGTAKRYRIVVRGEFGEILTAAFPEVTAKPGEGRTMLAFTVADEQELYGILDRLRDFAISIVSISEMEGEEGSP
jgi:hypothetical protein